MSGAGGRGLPGEGKARRSAQKDEALGCVPGICTRRVPWSAECPSSREKVKHGWKAGRRAGASFGLFGCGWVLSA